jgi:hypothetical protein
MYFEAEIQGRKYKVDVNETRHSWKVSLQQHGSDWQHHDISKDDFNPRKSILVFFFKVSPI